MNVLRDEHADLNVLSGCRVAVIGYGNQGAAHAMNLRDSGVDVVVGQREGSSFDAAVRDGFTPVGAGQAVDGAALVILALPDDRMSQIYQEEIAPVARAGQTIGFIHGFNVHFGAIMPAAELNVVMIAPKGPGKLLRSRFATGGGIAGLMAIAQNADGRAREVALAWAKGIGCTRVGVMETSFADETVTDLFGEQTVLCGGVIELMRHAFDTLVEAGHAPELAYFECVHEVKQVVDLIYVGGLEYMRSRISSTARFGGLERGPEIVGDDVRAKMKEALADIVSGAFAKRFIADTRSGGRQMQKMIAAESQYPMAAAQKSLFQTLGWDAPAIQK